ncbi:pentapeptide repeat-containing protein [Maridesulfovibrio sp.]|uniref:pentapeptide repeat-containing protein n=1 Tax=Maridesulfovibrio sp. TaxID=2795000 RepID=UPI002AA848E3|nr:pentapeptide repeat-containing protein [Maridesulfovibrio sp.]
MGCCVGAKHNNWCEDYDIVYIDADGKEYCIFHAPVECKFDVPKGKPYDERAGGDKPALMGAEQFNQLVFARIDEVIEAGEDEERDKLDPFQAVIGDGWNPRCNFSGTIFPYEISFSEYDGQNDKYLPPINFSRSQFRGDAYFSRSQFRGEAYFSDSQFRVEAYFSRSQFRGYADFRSSQFRGKASFLSSQFRGGASFSRSQFRGDADFSDSQFRGEAYFSDSQFRGYADFSDSQFRRGASFSRSQFRGEAYFSRSQFRGDAYFSSSQFRGDAEFSSSQFRGYADFRRSQFRGDAEFSSSQFRGDAEFSSSQFRGDAEFSSSQFRGYTDFRSSVTEKQTNFDKVKFGKSTFNQMEFKGPVYFDNSSFENKASFHNTIFHEYSNFEQTVFEDGANFNLAFFKEWTYFRDSKFLGETSFAGAISKETILLESTNLYNLKLDKTNIESFKFIDCNWGKERFAKIYDERTQQKTDCKNTTLAEIYRRLKKIARENADEEQTSHWHYREKEMALKCLQNTQLAPIGNILATAIFMIPLCIFFLEIKPMNIFSFGVATSILCTAIGIAYDDYKKITDFNKAFNKIYLKLYRFISGYGEDPIRAGVILFCLILLPFFLQLITSLTPWANGDSLKTAMWYMPLIKIEFDKAVGLHYLLKGLSTTAITLQAALFGFALRNKLRR